MTQDNNFMSLGLFVFTVQTAIYDKLQRDTKIMWGKKQAIGVGPTHQFVGLDEDRITLSGSLVPPITGGADQIDKLRAMSLKGKSWNLVDGAGKDLGAWFIDSVSQTGSFFKGNGEARRIEFSLSLKLAPDLKALGNLRDSA
jgi:phage tail protein